MRKNQMLVLALVAVALWLVTRSGKALPNMGSFTPASIFNPNGGDNQVFNWDRKNLNGGYTGTMGNVSDGNAYSMGL
jgi:hypothetical protein